MHQYIREQANALAWRRLEEYHQLWEWEGYEVPEQSLPHQGPLFRGGGQVKRGQRLVRGPLSKKPKSKRQ